MRMALLELREDRAEGFGGFGRLGSGGGSGDVFGGAGVRHEKLCASFLLEYG